MKNNKNKLENSVDNLIEEIRTPMVELNNIQLTQLNFLKDEVDFVIKNSVKDEKRIEKDFDMLLDLVYWFGKGIEKEYYDLLKYYKKIDLDVAKDYEHFYLEIINEED